MSTEGILWAKSMMAELECRIDHIEHNQYQPGYKRPSDGKELKGPYTCYFVELSNPERWPRRGDDSYQGRSIGSEDGSVRIAADNHPDTVISWAEIDQWQRRPQQPTTHRLRPPKYGKVKREAVEETVREVAAKVETARAKSIREVLDQMKGI